MLVDDTEVSGFGIIGVYTFKNKQSSEPTTFFVFLSNCTHGVPKFVASLNPFHFSGGSASYYWVKSFMH